MTASRPLRQEGVEATLTKDRVLQAEWKRGGEAALSFEILEMVKERDDPDFDYAAELRGLEQIHRQLQGLAA